LGYWPSRAPIREELELENAKLKKLVAERNLEIDVETVHVAPGKPWENGTGESFNGRFREECLNLEWFRNRTEAKVVIETWRRHYTRVRPHSSLGNLRPLEFKRHLLQSSNLMEASLK
jgi:transposase InsO family protein